MRNQAVCDTKSVDQATRPQENYVEISRVTVQQILDEFMSVKDTFDWRLTAQGRIQGTLKNDAEGHVFDPVSAIAILRTGRYFPEGHSGRAARSLGLSFLDSAELVAACNYGLTTDTGPGSLRRKLMAAAFGKSEMIEGALVAH
jgi:hypothetical protein